MTHFVKMTDSIKFVGRSAWAHQLRHQVNQVAQHPYCVLITGPSGTGKEVAARAIHELSRRADGPFIPVNCAAIPPALFASQLFGHVKGAFTGAQFATLGCFRAAEGGTIFLDEIAELDLESQAQLLRVLQEKVVTPVGSHESVPVNVRTIVATNRNLPDEVREGRFRLDLYYRLNVLAVETIGLAERVEDIGILAEHFLAKIAMDTGVPLKRLEPCALAVLEGYHWPGNVRELQNRIERAVVHSDSDRIRGEAFAELLRHQEGDSQGIPQILPGGLIRPKMTADKPLPFEGGLSPDPCQPTAAKPLPGKSSVPVTAPTLPAASAAVAANSESLNWDHWPTLEEIERNHIEQTLKGTFHNQSAAARLLGVDRKLLSRKIKKYGLQRPQLPWEIGGQSTAAGLATAKPR
jgi:DNA-binding NtrC family response regulator